jgi:NAD(P)-dependent dehydrogenase (short-subunit alcohol dehydrogenase family)
MSGRLQDKRAIVTGGSEGIGAAIVRAFADEGARVLAVARRADVGEAFVRELGSDSVAFFAADVTAPAAAEEVVAHAVRELGGIDVLVNNAGMDYAKPLLESPMEEVRELVETNFLAPLRFLQAVTPAMDSAGGAIVNITSRTAMAGVPTLAIYGGVKGALLSLTRGAAIELVDRGIRVNAVAPGLTDTPLVRKWINDQEAPEAFERDTVATVPQRRLARPEEVAEAVVYLASDKAAHVTGASIPVDGGYTAA